MIKSPVDSFNYAHFMPPDLTNDGIDPRAIAGGKDVCAVMVTYEGGQMIDRTARALIDQIAHLVIVDNHSGEATQAYIKNLENLYTEKITVILNRHNLGLAAALNQGVAYVREHGFRYVLTMDQDSLPAPDMVYYLKAVYLQDQAAEIGAVGPLIRLIYDHHKELRNLPDAEEEVIEETVVWTGGCLHPIEVFEKVGRFREEYFIDNVDYEFCFRLRKAGFSVLKATRALMSHHKGELKTAPFLWRRCFVSNYSASRRYYMARNGLIYWFESESREYLRGYIKTHLNEIPKIILYEPNKIRKLYLMLRGILDGLRKKTGALAADHQTPARRQAEK